jgi:thermitase
MNDERPIRRRLVAALSLILGTGPAHSAEPVPPAKAKFVRGQLLVQFKSGANAAARRQVRRSVGGIRRETLRRKRMPAAPDGGDLELVALPPGTSLTRALREFRKNPAVEFAEPNWIYTIAAQSNDTYYRNGLLWGLYGDRTSPASHYGSQAGEAWQDGATGSNEIIVGVIDEGIQIDHPDLAANVWTNPFDPPDGVDNDGNGYIDDIHGWDVLHDDNTVYDGGAAGTTDTHGTHVAGIIGARGGNRIGIAGINWKVTLISCKWGEGEGAALDAVKCLDYLTDLKTRHGLNIVAVNNSWGGGGYSQALLDAIDRAGDAGILFVAAAGNDSSDNDAAPHYPSNYRCTRGGTREFDCVVAVAALNSFGTLASFSNYGAAEVDLAAPGVAIYSTLPPNRYGPLNGTSMAAPHVTGAIALYAATHRDPATGAVPDAAALRRAVLDSAAATPGIAGRTATGGRLDVFEALAR